MRRGLMLVLMLLLLPAAALAQQTAYVVRQCNSGCTGWDLMRYDVASGTKLADIHLSSHPVLGEVTLEGSGEIAVTADGRRAYVTFHNRIIVVDLVTTALSNFASVVQPFAPVVNSSGQRLYALNYHTGLLVYQLVEVNTTTGERDNTVTLTGVSSPQHLAVLPDESAAYFATSTHVYKVVRATGDMTSVALSNVADLVTSPDGTRVYALHGGGVVTALDSGTLATVSSLTLVGAPMTPTMLAMGPDGTQLFAGMPGNTLFSGLTKVMSTSPLAETADRIGGGRIRIDPTGTRLLAVGNSTGTSSNALVRLVAVSSGQTTELEAIPTTQSAIRDTAVGPEMSCSAPGVAPTTASVSQAGGTGSVSVTAALGCAWTVTSSAAWVTIDSGSGGAGSGTVRYTVSVNPTTSARQATITVSGQSVVITQAANPNVLTATPSTLRMAAFRPVPTLVGTTTPSQRVTLSYTGSTVPQWTATSDQPWVTISPASGSGVAQLSVSLSQSSAVLPSSAATATITIAAPNASLLTTVTVTFASYTTLPTPTGMVDTPVQGATGLQGAIAFTGWAIDGVGIDRVEVYRNCVASDVPGTCPSLGGRPVVFLGNATRVPGARPDVATAFPEYPDIDKAGWGINILSNMLPNIPAGQSSGGVGTLELMAFAVTGGQNYTTKTLLGRSRLDQIPTTVTLANDTIAKPFGAIDTPAQGATISGSVNNFGWVLTPDPGTGVLMPIDGSTVTVFINGAPIGTATYNLCRGSVAVGGIVPSGQLCNDDVSTVFRGGGTLFRNLDAGRGPIGLRTFDASALANGQHTLSWAVTDSAGRSEGIGSRYINVLNTSADHDGEVSRWRDDGMPLGTSALRHSDTSAPRHSGTSVFARTGFDLSRAFTPLVTDADGVAQVRIPELGRVEMQLPGVISGALLVNGEERPLPIGVGIDTAQGIVTWATGVGFLGRYQLVLRVPQVLQVLQVHDEVRVDVTVVPAQLMVDAGVRMHVDRAEPQCPIGSLAHCSISIAGWALDTGASSGVGIGAVHVWAKRVLGSDGSYRSYGSGEPVFLGVAQLGIARPDVAAAHGAQYPDAGFTWAGALPEAGTWEITAYVWSWRTGRFEDARTVTVVVK